MKKIQCLLFLLLPFLPATVGGQEVRVTIHPDDVQLVSEFRLGITYVGDWDSPWTDQEALAQTMKLIVDGGFTLQNTHIIGFGAGDFTTTNKNGGKRTGEKDWDWAVLDHRVARMREMNAEIVFTLCTAPGHMKKSGNSWDMKEKVLPDYWEEYAELCVKVAQRYPDVKHFQVWNELKGWWQKDIKGFTQFYNVVYRRLRAYLDAHGRKDARIAGPYMAGLTESLAVGKGEGKLAPADRASFERFLSHMEGAEILNYGGWLAGFTRPPGRNPIEPDRLMDNTACFGILTAELKKMIDRPIWISELYGAQERNIPEGSDFDHDQFLAANYASVYKHCLEYGVAVGLHWEGKHPVRMFTGTSPKEQADPARRAQTTPLYDVGKAFNLHFPRGTEILRSESSDPERVEVLASRLKFMLINKRNSKCRVKVGGTSIDLEPYGVRVLDAPGRND